MQPRARSSRIQLNDFATQWQEIRADALAAMDRVGASGWLVLGEEVRQLELELARLWRRSYAVASGNGLDALEISLRALGLRDGDRVLTTPLSAFATTLAIVRAGGVPVFVDVDASGLIDLDRCADALASERSLRFLLPVHLYGHALDAERLGALASRFDLEVVEDCAQSIGASSRGAPVGTTGRMSATSFYPTKNLGCLGDGGAILTDDASLAERARSLRNYGQSEKYVHSVLGLNSRLDEVQAAVLRSALLPRLAALTERRRAIARRFRAGISNPALELPPSPPGSESVWHLFPVLVAGDRERFAAHLDRAGIACGAHYPVLIPDQPAMTGARFATLGPLEHARIFSAREASLPIHPFLSEDDVDRVIDACNAWHT